MIVLIGNPEVVDKYIDRLGLGLSLFPIPGNDLHPVTLNSLPMRMDETQRQSASQPNVESSVLQRNIDIILDKATNRNPSFLAAISHEMRTPLNGIIGIIDLMSRGNCAEDLEMYLRTLEHSCRGLMSVVNRCQDLSGLQEASRVDDTLAFDLNAVVTGVSQVMQFYNDDSPETTQVHIVYDPRLPRVIKADLTRIQQVITNLCVVGGNASQDGYVNINLALRYLNNADCKIRVVIDSGPVGRPEYLDLQHQAPLDNLKDSDMFNPRALNNMQITVDICRKFLDELGSRLIASELYGCRLRFQFDLNVESAEKLPRDDNGLERIEEVKVMVVDDNKVNRMIVSRMLDIIGVTRYAANSGREAIQVLLDKGWNIDMVFMDLDMPDIDGYEATEQIRNVWKSDITIVALTANSTNQAKQRCKDIGMQDFFTKPITIQTLREMIAKWRKTT